MGFYMKDEGLINAATWKDTAAGTMLSDSVSAVIGKPVVAIVTTRSATTFPAGWEHVIETPVNCSSTTVNQYIYVIRKNAEGDIEELTVTQADSARIYMQMLAFRHNVSFTELWRYESNISDVTVPAIPSKQLSDKILWALSSTLWSSTQPYKGWGTTPNDIIRYSSAVNNIQPRQAAFLDNSRGATERGFIPETTDPSGLGILMLKIESDDYNPIFDYPQIEDFLDLADCPNPFVEYEEPKPGFAFKIDADKIIMQGYPYVFEYIKPLEPPERGGAYANTKTGYQCSMRPLTVTFSDVINLSDGDEFVIRLEDGASEVYTGKVSLSAGSNLNIDISIPVDTLDSLSIGNYTVKAFILRKQAGEETEYCAYSLTYAVSSLPSLVIKNITPNTLSKPILPSTGTDIVYEISGDGIARISNTFEISGFTASQALKSAELLAISSATKTARIYDVSFTFNVTDPEFKLHSFKFLFGDYSAVDEVDYRIDNVSVMKGNYPMNDWVEYTAPVPVTLGIGSHTIRIYNSPSYWYLFSTTSKPTVPGMTITSSTVYAMEMVYTLSASGVGGERTIKITLDDSIEAGVYPLKVESSADLTGYGVYEFSLTADDMLEVLEAAILDPDIGAVSLSKTGRYTGCETDITVNVSGLANILAGDMLKICLKNRNTDVYENSAVLALNAESYSHTISASVFEGLGVGSYSVTAVVSRGSFDKEASAAYRVLAKPSVDFVSITSDIIQLPITSPLTVTSAWKAAGEGINSIQGSVSIQDTAYTASINTANLNFNAAFSNVTVLTAGMHSLDVDLTVTSNEYGSVSVAGSHTSVLEVLEAIPDPEIGGISLSSDGRYVGSETNVTVNVSGLQHVTNGDVINLRICQGSAVFYEHTKNPVPGSSVYDHTIPRSVFTGLDAGNYVVKAVIKRGDFTTSEIEAAYRAVPKPTIRFISITPERIQLPIVSPISIVITMEIDGEGINEISGSVELGETGYSAGVSVSGLDISATLSNITDLNAQGYFIAVSLTVNSDLYGTATLISEFENVLRVLEVIIPKDLRSGVLYIYKGFELVAVLRNYISFKWIRRYNKIGEFLLQLENTARNVDLIHSGNIIAKDNDDEAGFIEDITITDMIEVKGMFITKMLTFRICSLTSETPVDLQSTVEQLIRSNYINTTASRVIPDFRIADFSINPQSVAAKIENGSVAQWLENQDVGFKVKFNTAENKFDFFMYDGRQSGAVFCESYRNITDQQYYEQTANSKNVCYVEGEEQVHEVGSAQGLNRREAYAKAGKYDPLEYGNVFLKQNKPVESLDVKIINPYSPFEYKTDYDVGDIVKVTSEEYRVEITKNILEITEFLDHTGFHLYIVFGDIPRDLLTELQDKESRLEALENAPETEPPGELTEETIEDLKELIIPEIVDEVFEQLEFPPLPDYLTEEKLRETIETIVDGKLEGFNPPGGGTGGDGTGGDGIHVIIDHLPTTQAEIDTFPLNAEVLVYDPNNPYIPPN